MICVSCGSPMRETWADISEEYRGRKFVVSGIRHLECPSCHEYSLGAEEADELSRALVRAYAAETDLLNPEDISEIRHHLGLTQSDFQKLIGVSGVTVSRWETGVAQQSKSMDNLLRGIRHYPEFASELAQRAGVVIGGKNAPKEKALA